jgi:hypothetical protein
VVAVTDILEEGQVAVLVYFVWALGVVLVHAVWRRKILETSPVTVQLILDQVSLHLNKAGIEWLNHFQIFEQHMLNINYDHISILVHHQDPLCTQRTACNIN